MYQVNLVILDTYEKAAYVPYNMYQGKMTQIMSQHYHPPRPVKESSMGLRNGLVYRCYYSRIRQPHGLSSAVAA